MRCSFRMKLALAMGVPLLATYLLMAWAEYSVGRQEALADMESHLTDLVGRWAAELNGDLAVAEGIARSAATVCAMSPELENSEIKVVMQGSLRDNPKVFGMCAAFEPEVASREALAAAAYWCREPGDRLRYVDVSARSPGFREADWYRRAKSGRRPFWTEPYFDTGIGERIMCTYSAPVLRGGRFAGVMTVDLVSEDLLQEISRIRIDGGYCMLISRQGAFISHPDSSLLLRESVFSLAERHGLSELAEAGAEITAGKRAVQRVRDYRDGSPKWMAYAPVEAAGWALVAVLPESAVLAPVHGRLRRLLALLAAGLAVIPGTVLLVSLRITRPLARLAAAAETLGSGNLKVRVPELSGRDEVAMLSLKFNQMVADLDQSVTRRIQEEAQRRKVEGELKAAREIQSSLLPRMLADELQKGFTLHAVNSPARTVAGDFFDFFFLDGRRLALVIADVAGKGPPAAMYMAVVRTRIRDFASADKTPAQVVTEVNRALAAENEGCMFVTLFLGYYDPPTGELVYVNAGHNPPYVVRADNGIDSLGPTGPIVGPFADPQFYDGRCRIEDGNLLLLFTDGVTEAGGAGKGLFGERRLESLLRGFAPRTVVDACGAIIEAARTYSDGDLPDDATVMALRRTSTDEDFNGDSRRGRDGVQCGHVQ